MSTPSWLFGLSAAVALAASLGLPARGQGSDPEVQENDVPRTAPVIPSGRPPSGFGPPRHEPASRSQSVGATNSGRLLRGVTLEAGPTLHLKNDSTKYGTQEFVDLIQWARAQVDDATPGSRLLVGDLSRPRGGRLRPHRSHRAGRDADIGFYLVDAEGEPARNNQFVGLRANGTGTERRSGRELKFDDARNWQLVAALMGQDVVPVQYVMVVSPLVDRLLAEGARQGAPAWLLHRVREAVGPRRTGRGRAARYGTHNSHFHVRVYCDENDPRCRNTPPFWDWVSQPPPPPRVSPRQRRRNSMRSGMRVSMRAASMRRSTMRASSMQASSMAASSTRATRRQRANSMQ